MRKSKADDLSGWITEISEDPTQRMTRLEADLDEAHGRISDRMEDLQRERIENDGLRGALKAANNDYEALRTRFLPELSNYLTVPFDEPIPDDAGAQVMPNGDILMTAGGHWPPVNGDCGDDYGSAELITTESDS